MGTAIVGVGGFCGERLAKADKLWVESRNGQDSGPSWTGAESRAERRRRRRKREGRGWYWGGVGRCVVMTGEDGVVVVVGRKHQCTSSLHVCYNTDSKESFTSTVEWYGRVWRDHVSLHVPSWATALQVVWWMRWSRFSKV